MGCGKLAKFRVPGGGSAVLYDFRLPVFWRAAGGKKHMLRIGFCLLFYSAVALAYMALLTPIHAGNALRLFWQKPVFYRLWFFYAILVIYLLSPLVRVPPVSGRYLVVVVLILAVVANPNTPELTIGHTPLLPINVYIVGDTFYYLLYAVVGRALGTLTPTRWVTLGAVPLFVVSVLLIAMGTSQQTLTNDNFTQTFYLYANPLVFIAAVCPMILFKAAALSAPLPGFSFISRHSLAIYGFHALIIHFIRTRDLALKGWPIQDIFYVFSARWYAAYCFPCWCSDATSGVGLVNGYRSSMGATAGRAYETFLVAAHSGRAVRHRAGESVPEAAVATGRPER